MRDIIHWRGSGMTLLDPTSLQNTVDQINEALLSGEALSPDSALEAARWIAGRQGLKGSYRGSFAPTERDFAEGIRMFTGERLVYASARHILGEEAARAAWLLGREDPVVREAYQKAVDWMRGIPDTHSNGTFCCGHCTPAFWRHFWVGDFEGKEEFLVKGLRFLGTRHDEQGGWLRYPFAYTVYALTEIELEGAVAELRYARPRMERSLKSSRAGVVAQRRKLVMERALERVG
jgi:hypothetical protein